MMFKNSKLQKIMQGRKQKKRNQVAFECLRELGYPVDAIRGGLMKMNGVKIPELLNGKPDLKPSTVYQTIQGRPPVFGRLHEKKIPAPAAVFRSLIPPAETDAPYICNPGAGGRRKHKLVSKTLGHASEDTTWKRYNRFIPNLTREDGSALESKQGNGGPKRSKKGGNEVGS